MAETKLVRLDATNKIPAQFLPEVSDPGLATHLADTEDAHDASAISVTPAGLAVVTSTNVQAALAQLDAQAALTRRKATLPTAAKLQTFSRWIVNTTVVLVSGRLSLVLLDEPLMKGVSYTKIGFALGGNATVGLTHSWATLIRRSDLSRRAVTDDITAEWAGSSLREFTIAGGYTPAADEECFVGIMTTATTTMPQPRGITTSAVQWGSVIPGTIAAESTGVGLTDPASLPATLPGITPVNYAAYAYVG